MTPATTAILAEIAEERRRQHAKWGVQRHPFGTGTDPAGDREIADMARESCQRAFAEGDGTWRHILEEEVCEAFAESDPVKLRAELVQVAAVAVQMVEAIDRENIPHAYHPTAWCDGCARHGCGEAA
jgi:hypothetical protein